jgi:predicted DNA-binding transcriptional regulator AlpA
MNELDESLVLITTAQFSKMIGKSQRVIARMEREPDSDFPKRIIIRGRKHYRLSDVKAWIAKKAMESETKRTAFGPGRNAG